jgi:predicted MFS family arabinose efflux permease
MIGRSLRSLRSRGHRGRPVEEDAPVAALAPLRITAYRRLWYATTVSHLGTYLQLTVAPWLMLLMTRSPFMVGLITTALFLPRLVLTIPAGLLSDRLDRRLVLGLGYATCSLSAGALAVATSLDRLTPALLLVLTAGLGTGSAIAKPAHQTFLPDLVPPALRTPAITLSSASTQTARIVGPSIGGAFVAFGRADLAFGTNSLSFVVVLLALLAAPDPDRGRRTTGDRSGRGASGLLAGITYVRSNRAIRDLLLLTATFVLGAVSVQALLPNIVADGLGLGATAYGVLYGVFGLGAVAGAVSRERAAVWLHDATTPVSMVVFGLSSVALSWTVEPLLAATCLLVIGVTWVWAMTTLNARVQLGAPRWVRGRVIALFVLAVATKPLGAALAGAIAEVASLRVAFTVAGTLTVATGVVASRFPLSAVRVAPDEEADGTAGGPLPGSNDAADLDGVPRR